MKKILVITLSNLGDVVLTLPVFRALYESFPNAQIDVIVGSSAKCVFENDSRIHRLEIFNKRAPLSEKINILFEIRKRRYDLIIDLRHSLFGLLGGARKRNSYFSYCSKRSLRSLRHLSALRGICSVESSIAGSAAWLSRKAKLDASYDAFLNQSSVTGLVLAAVGSKSDTKKWPAEHFAALLDRLAFEKGVKIGLIGDKTDIDDALKVKNLMRASVHNFCGQTQFEELAGLIQASNLVITNDSAPLHIADALEIPVIGIFGPTDPRRYGPKGVLSAALRSGVFCSPCEKAQCRFKQECLKELSPDLVYRRADEILNESSLKKNFKVLVVRLDRMGDAVLSFPALSAIRRRFPNASISVLCRAAVREIFERCPDVDNVLPYFYEKGGRHSGWKGARNILKEIANRNFDVAFLLHPSTRAHLVPFLAGIPYRIGFDSHLPWLLTQKVKDVRSEGQKHESDYTLEIVRAFGVEESKENPRLIVYQADRENIIQKFKLLHSPIAIHAGASCPSKRWPQEKFLELCQKMKRENVGPVILVGGSEEIQIGLHLKESLGDFVQDLTGKLSLPELSAILKESRLLVSNDSGPVHVAAAVGTPTLTIFGRNQAGLSQARWKALGSGHETIQKNPGCVVCLAHACTIQFECLKQVGVDQVFVKLKEMLGSDKHEK